MEVYRVKEVLKILIHSIVFQRALGECKMRVRTRTSLMCHTFGVTLGLYASGWMNVRVVQLCSGAGD